jgi:ADP-heptose:LPS heptosyltransferase
MTLPAEHAAACLNWLADRDAANVARELADPRHPTFAYIEALAEAADSADESLRGAGLSALFGGLVEPLNDGFTPAGRAGYARWFARLCWHIGQRDERLRQQLAAFGIHDEAALQARYQAARHTPPEASLPAPAEARRVVILSRVTIGADLLLTTVVLQRLRQAYPTAELVVLGDAKLQALIGGFANVRVRALAYGRRGPLRERLASWLAVVEAVDAEAPDLVIAPDSRLDQLGILPVIADPTRYLLWENLIADGQQQSLARALDGFLCQRLGLPTVPFCPPRTVLDAPTQALSQCLAAAFGPAPLAAVKLDHGGNPAKALPRAAEVQLLQHLRAQGWRVLLDRGFGATELASSDELLAAVGWSATDLDDSPQGLGLAVSTLSPGQLGSAAVIRFHGSIGGWAAACAACRVAISYDSVGHHLAAGLGVPVITAFTGHHDPRFAVAWKPHGPGAVTLVEIPTAVKADPQQWQRLLAAIPAAASTIRRHDHA